VLVLLAFQFGEGALPGGGDEQQTFVAVSAAALLLGFMVLSTQAVPFSQIVGANTSKWDTLPNSTQASRRRVTTSFFTRA